MHWLLPVVGIGFIIFVHELGHFLAARAVGIRVEAFSIGFGPRLFGFRRGPTDYKICLIPLGGFVKMAGENPNAPRTGASDEFASKSVSQRTLVISAGVIMNVIFALVAIPIAFMIGVPFEKPVLGFVEPGGPAWKAGLRSGDRIVSIDDRRMLNYEDVVTAVAIGGDVVEVVAERGGRTLTTSIPTVRDEVRGLPTIDVDPEILPIEIKPDDVDPALADDDKKEAAAHRARSGLRAGDRIVLIDGTAISEFQAPADELRPRILSVDRSGNRIEIVLEPLFVDPGEDAPKRLGLVAAHLTALEVAPGSPAADAGLRRGDRIASIAGEGVFTLNELARALAKPLPDGDVGVVGPDGFFRRLPVRLSDPAVRASIGRDVAYETSDRIVIPSPGGAAEAAGIQRGDQVVSANGVAIDSYSDISSLDPAIETVTLGVKRGEAESGVLLSIPVTRKPMPQNKALLGLELEHAREIVKKQFGESIVTGVDYTVMMTARIFMTLKSLFTRRVSPENLGGIITIFRQSEHSSRISFSRALLFLAVISINLAVLNILPIPILDGGWLLLLLIEKIRGRPVPERVLGVVSWVGFVLIVGLMLFVTWNDIQRLI